MVRRSWLAWIAHWESMSVHGLELLPGKFAWAVGPCVCVRAGRWAVAAMKVSVAYRSPERGEQTFTLVALDTDTVWTVKQRLYAEVGVLPNRMTLHARGSKPLSNSKTLAKCGVRNGATLTLTVNTVEAAITGDASVVDPAACFAFGVGLHHAIAQHPASFRLCFASRKGVQIPARALVDDGLVYVEVGGTPADIELLEPDDTDGTCRVTYLPYSASAAATIHVRVRDAPIAASPFALTVASLGTQALPSLLESAPWTAAALEAILHSVDQRHDFEIVSGDVMAALLKLFAERPRHQARVLAIFESLLREDASKRQLVTPTFCWQLLDSGLAHQSRALHGIVCRFLARHVPHTALSSATPLLIVPPTMLGNAQWTQL